MTKVVLVILLIGWLNIPKMQVIEFKNQALCNLSRDSWSKMSPDIKAECFEINNNK